MSLKIREMPFRFFLFVEVIGVKYNLCVFEGGFISERRGWPFVIDSGCTRMDRVLYPLTSDT